MYCENVTDCRRSLQLNYFDENFTNEHCSQFPRTACDNCLNKNQFKIIDVLSQCRAIARTVNELCMGSKRLTLLYISDVLKGSNLQKIRNSEHDRHKHFGLLKSWAQSDIHRLLHKMVLDDFLKEQLVFCKDIPQAYLKLGNKVDLLMSSNTSKIEFSMKEETSKPRAKEPGTSAQTATTSSDSVDKPVQIDLETSEKLTALQDRCNNDLLEVCRQLAATRNVTMGSIMNMQAIKVMAEKMPTTEEEMLSIQHVTKANYEKYGRELLEITQQYGAEKLCK